MAGQPGFHEAAEFQIKDRLSFERFLGPGLDGVRPRFICIMIAIHQLQSRRRWRMVAAMFNLVSLVIGFFALGGAILGFFPFFGWMNWAVVPVALMGAAFGILSRADSGRRLNSFVLVVGIVRLIMGGGIF